jgi:hypothetical protein
VFKEHKVDVVLSTVTTAATAAQKSLVDAAKLAAVKLFLPSEYGFVTEVKSLFFPVEYGVNRRVGPYRGPSGS